MSCGMGEKANVFPHGHNELFKMKEQKYFQLKYGVLKKNINGNIRPLSQTNLHFLFTNATLEWGKMQRKLVLMLSLKRKYCHE